MPQRKSGQVKAVRAQSCGISLLFWRLLEKVLAGNLINGKKYTGKLFNF